MRPSHEAGSCPYAQGPLDSPGSTPDQQGGAGRVNTAALISHLYDCHGLSTYEIAKMVGISRQRVGRLLKKVGVPVKPRGAGRQRKPDSEQAALTDLAVRLYQRSNLSSGQISALTGMPDRTIRDRLRARGVRMRTRGWANREDRVAAPPEALVEHYIRAGLTAAETGRRLGVPGRVVLRTAHDQGLPVRIGGPEPRHGPSEIELGRRPVCRSPGAADAVLVRHTRSPSRRAHLASVPYPCGHRRQVGQRTIRLLRAGPAPYRAGNRAACGDCPEPPACARNFATAPWRQIAIHAQMAEG